MRQETILIIDDEISVRESLSAFLKDEGYQVFSADNGRNGLDLFFREAVDLVLTDLRMPGIDGLEVMERIHGHNPDIPMLVVSGAGKRQDIIKALQMGAKDYITKPIQNLDMIRHVVEKALENKFLIEQNKRYRRQLEKSEARYRTITEQIAEGVFTVDLDEKITFSNPAFCKMLGYSQAELANMTLGDLTTSDAAFSFSPKDLSCKDGQDGRYEVQLTDSQGNPVHVELAFSPLNDDQNNYSGAIAVARDITQLIQLREKYQKFLKIGGDTSKNIVAICANCKSIRGEGLNWQQVEEFFNHIAFSHGICPDCCQRLYPDIDMDDGDL